MPKLPSLLHTLSRFAPTSRLWSRAEPEVRAPTLEERRAAAAERAKHHRLMLWIAGAIIAGTFLLEVLPDQRVALRGLTSYPLPELCGSRLALGIECPGCGLTRSFIWAGRGEWLRALEVNRVGFLMMLAVVGQIPYRILMLRHFERGEMPELAWPRRFGWALIAMLFGNWALKICGV